MTIYKIRRTSDGKFYTGPKYKQSPWSALGRAYNSISLVRRAVTSGLRGTGSRFGPKIRPTDHPIEIVEYEVTQTRVLEVTAE